MVWIPREDQLREMIENRLMGETQPAVLFCTTEYGYRCDIHHHGETLTFEQFGAGETYAAALLHLLDPAAEEL